MQTTDDQPLPARALAVLTALGDAEVRAGERGDRAAVDRYATVIRVIEDLCDDCQALARELLEQRAWNARLWRATRNVRRKRGAA